MPRSLTIFSIITPVLLAQIPGEGTLWNPGEVADDEGQGAGTRRSHGYACAIGPGKGKRPPDMMAAGGPIPPYRAYFHARGQLEYTLRSQILVKSNTMRL